MIYLLYTSVTLLLMVCVFLILLILIQKGRGGGLASAFGGGGGNTAFGSKTGDVLTWATSIVFGIFLLLSIVTNLTADSVHHSRLTSIPPAPSAPAGMPPGPGDMGLPPPSESPGPTLPTTESIP